MGVRSLAGVCVCACTDAPRFPADPWRWRADPGPDAVEGALKAGGLLRPGFEGVRAGAGVFGNSPGVGRNGVTGGYDMF
jgi:hypothetical protein